MSDIAALLERVRAATGPDDALDDDIWLAVIPGATRRNVMAEWPDEKPIWEYSDPARNLVGRILVRRLTASVDAALALVERALPTQHITLGQNVHHHYWVCTFNLLDEEGAVRSNGSSHAAPTPALAILAALLLALKDQHHD